MPFCAQGGTCANWPSMPASGPPMPEARIWLRFCSRYEFMLCMPTISTADRRGGQPRAAALNPRKPEPEPASKCLGPGARDVYSRKLECFSYALKCLQVIFE
ncbi:jg11121 [Pararge aegeria aegeria]|uniref:Jg11121 protein n=1 Tax=Pararge aegeria aegeria TaxID=348720 RepID=A0A8S4RJZ4_9NEOP|nr:jg11121 [Pararge aegeria aegeria]